MKTTNTRFLEMGLIVLYSGNTVHNILVCEFIKLENASNEDYDQ